MKKIELHILSTPYGEKQMQQFLMLYPMHCVTIMLLKTLMGGQAIIALT